MLINLIFVLNWLIFCFLLLIIGGYTLLLFTSLYDIFYRYQEIKVGNIFTLMKSKIMPPVTAIIAAYNEEENILNAVDSILNSTYPNTQILIINDGSTDKTLDKLISKYKLYKISTSMIPDLIKVQSEVKGYYISKLHPTIMLIDKTHFDKSDSLNVGLNACRTPLLITVDADSVIEPETISEMVYYMLTNPRVVAVGGSVFILNNCKVKEGKIIDAKMPYSFLLGLQACEYLRSFLFARAGWNPFGGSLSFSGTATLFEYNSVLDIGGFDIQNAACDFEIITKLHVHNFKNKNHSKIGYTAAAAVWTDVPNTLKRYWNQRLNWQIGQLRSLLCHKEMLFNPKFGVIGLFSYPFFLFAESFGAIIEISAYLLLCISWLLGILDSYAAILLFFICLGFVVLLTLLTLLMSFATYNKYQRMKDIPWVLILSIVEIFGFRQLNVICRVVGTVRYFLGKTKIAKKD